MTTDSKGDYESSGYSSGYSDEANVSNNPQMPTQTPPLQTLELPYGNPYENRTFEVEEFTNASITTSSFDPSRKALYVNVTVPQGTSGFTDLILAQDFLSRPYNITLDGKAVSAIEGDTNTSSYIYLALKEGFHTVSLSGAEVGIPSDLNGDFKVSLQDLVILANAYGSKPGYLNWNPNADIDGNGIVHQSDANILAQHYGQHYP